MVEEQQTHPLEDQVQVAYHLASPLYSFIIRTRSHRLKRIDSQIIKMSSSNTNKSSSDKISGSDASRIQSSNVGPLPAQLQH